MIAHQRVQIHLTFSTLYNLNKLRKPKCSRKESDEELGPEIKNIMLHKKGEITETENYRSISLSNDRYKLTRIIAISPKTQLNLYQPQEQDVFRTGYGRNNHFQTLKLLIKKMLEYIMPLILFFCWFLNRNCGSCSNPEGPKQLRNQVQFICNIYKNATTTIRLHIDWNWINIARERERERQAMHVTDTVYSYPGACF